MQLQLVRARSAGVHRRGSGDKVVLRSAGHNFRHPIAIEVTRTNDRSTQRLPVPASIEAEKQLLRTRLGSQP